MRRFWKYLSYIVFFFCPHLHYSFSANTQSPIPLQRNPSLRRHIHPPYFFRSTVVVGGRGARTVATSTNYDQAALPSIFDFSRTSLGSITCPGATTHRALLQPRHPDLTDAFPSIFTGFEEQTGIWIITGCTTEPPSHAAFHLSNFLWCLCLCCLNGLFASTRTMFDGYALLPNLNISVDTAAHGLLLLATKKSEHCTCFADLVGEKAIPGLTASSSRSDLLLHERVIG